MPLHVTQQDIEMAHRYARDAMAVAKGVGAKEAPLSRTTKNLGKLAAVIAGSGLVGIASGYKPGMTDLHIGGKVIPLDGLGGLVGLGASVFMEDSAASETLANFSVGVFGAFATKYAMGMGKSLAEGKGLFGAAKAPAQVSGQAPLRVLAGGKQVPASTPQPSPLSAEELAAIGKAAR